MNSRLYVIANLRAKSGCRDELRKRLLHLVEETRKEPGCLEYSLFEQREAPGHFTFWEAWTGRDALDAHFETPHMQEAERVLPPLMVGKTEIIRLGAVE